MIPDEIVTQTRNLLYAKVGAFFTNTSRGPGRCAVCTAPALAELLAAALLSARTMARGWPTWLCHSPMSAAG